MKKNLLLLGLSLFFVASITMSCREKTTGEKVEDAIENTGDAIEDGAEEVGDAVEDATDGN